ncbi:MAG: carboxypeptidase regulatory-like domain-containing protein [Candidatus Hydrogenedentes bacterium]|nr:carboxypeptidase regulatory-like domain-containing protein [Candidatus Hydrogenedentota bacterium]
MSVNTKKRVVVVVALMGVILVTVLTLSFRLDWWPAPSLRPVARPASIVKSLPTLPAPVSEPVPSPPAVPLPAPKSHGVIVGKVYAPDGTPASGAKTAVQWLSPRDPPVLSQELPAAVSVVADEQGSFEFRNLQWGWYSVESRLGNAIGTSGALLSPGDPSSRLSIQLHAAMLSISGIVVNRQENPIDKAKVIPVLQDGEKVQSYYRASFATHTDPLGQFVVSGLGPKMWEFYVVSETYAPLWSERLESGTTDARLVMTKGGGISGRVVRAETGEPMPNFALLARIQGIDVEPRRTVTDEAGRFAFDLLAARPHALAPENTRLVVVEGAGIVNVIEGQTVGDVTLKVAEGGVVRGRVSDSATDAGLAEVRVFASAKDPRAPKGHVPVARTDAEGRYELGGLANGNYRITAESPAGYPGLYTYWSGNQRTVAAVPGKAIDGIDFEFSRGCVVSGMVVDSQGQTVPCAEVIGRTEPDNRRERATANEDGQFLLSGFAPNQQVRLCASSFDLRSEIVGPYDIPAEGLRDVRIVLELAADAVVSGVVVDRRGAPKLAAVMVVRPDIVLSGFAPPNTTLTDPEGRFIVTGLAAAEYDIKLGPYSSYRQGILTATTLTLRPHEVRAGLRLVYDDSHILRISGRVTDSGGQPVAHAQVSVVGDDHRIRSASTNWDGQYTVENVCEGMNTVEVKLDGYGPAAPREVPASSEGVDFVLPSRSRVEGQVLDQRTGKPVTEFEIGYRGSGPLQRVSDPGGRFALELPSDARTLVVHAANYRPGEAGVPHRAPGPVVSGIVIALQPGLSRIEGFVRDLSGNPVPSAFISLGETPPAFGTSGGPPADAVAQTDADGRFVLENISPRSTRVFAASPDYAPGWAEIDPQAADVQQVEIVLVAGGSLEGMVTEAGQPVERAIVTVEAEVSLGQAFTGPDGRYRIDNLVPGEVTVRVLLRSPGSDSDEPPPTMEQPATIVSDNVTTLDLQFSPK